MERFRPKTYTARYPRWMVGKPLLIASSALASLGDALFGYSQGVIAAVQVQPPFIKRFFGRSVTIEQIQAGTTGVDPYVQAITVACLNITALFAALGSAYVCDILGRRMSIRIGAFIYLVAAFIQLFAPDLGTLIVGRSIQGLAVGMLSMTVPILQCEIAPGHARGLFISVEYLCLNSGYLLSSWVGYGFFFALPSEISWRGPYIIQAVLAVMLLVWTFVLPETPRFLISTGFEEEGLRTLADLHAAGDIDDPGVQRTYAEIVAAITYERTLGEASWGQLFKQYTRRTVMAITCQMFAQFNGINALLYFLPSNLTRAGFSIASALLYSGVSAIVYCLGTIPTMFLIDKWGRRPFLLTGSAALAACLATVGGLQYHADSLPVGNARLPSADGIFAAICIYLFFYGATWGPGPYLLGAEIFPLRARAKGMALSITSNWLCNFIIAFITPPLFSSIGGGYYFLLLGFCVVSGVFVWFVYPETAHRTLEEMGAAFGDKISIDQVVANSRLGSAAAKDEDLQSEATTLRASIGDKSVLSGRKGSDVSV
ncbi:Probable glucose transporter rco-3 [Sparassis crispa]|uniref:Probable glucose transporter rco-3 n=1 Tax=Sparassis crispa TaxID=139825 RepID=A0A401GIG6_9APHY|nr:Probable glucose transporter rco-3 [Sparassis crispa]GBE81967.1 Probable glucose transporter rco-3 [Sparassis crispa]